MTSSWALSARVLFPAHLHHISPAACVHQERIKIIKIYPASFSFLLSSLFEWSKGKKCRSVRCCYRHRFIFLQTADLSEIELCLPYSFIFLQTAVSNLSFPYPALDHIVQMSFPPSIILPQYNQASLNAKKKLFCLPFTYQPKWCVGNGQFMAIIYTLL